MISLPLPLPPVRRQNMKVRINATGDTIVMKFLRPSPDVKLEGYILGYGSNMFSKQFIQLPENGQPYETEVGKCQYGSLQRTQTMIEAQSLINKKSQFRPGFSSRFKPCPSVDRLTQPKIKMSEFSGFYLSKIPPTCMETVKNNV